MGDNSKPAWWLIQSIWRTSWHWLQHNEDFSHTTLKLIWLCNLLWYILLKQTGPVAMQIPGGGVDLRGKWAGVTLTVYVLAIRVLKSLFYLESLSILPPHTPLTSPHWNGERGVKWGIEKQQERQLQAPAAIQQNSFECTLFLPCWDLACQSEHVQLYLDGMFIHLERDVLSNSLSK